MSEQQNSDGTPADDGSVMDATDRDISNTENRGESDQGQHSRRLSKERDDSDDDDAMPANDDDGAGDDEGDDGAGDDDEGDTFPRPYVERLRARSAGYRARAKTAETRAAELEGALFTERVRALDVLADPTDLPFDADLLDDPDGLREAVDALVRSRPHYRRRGVAGDTGARDRPERGDTTSLLGIMRGGA